MRSLALCVLSAPLLFSYVSAQQSNLSVASGADPCEIIATQQSDYLDEGKHVDSSHHTLLILPGIDPQTIGLNATTLYKCLTSVPLVQSDALDYLRYAKAYGTLQSDIAFIKQPTKAWQQPASDILGALDSIANKVKAGSYKSQYDFDADVLRLARTANDFHFGLRPGVLGSNYWDWSLQYQLTSFSVDGQQLPKVYVYQDILQKGKSPSQEWQASAVATLDGKPVVQYLSELALNRNLVGVSESHTEWNIMMQNSPYGFGAGAATDTSLFSVSQFYPGETLSVTFENGTKFTWQWYGNCKKNMQEEDWTDAETIYNKVVLRQQNDEDSGVAKKRQNEEFFPLVDEPVYIKYRPYYIPVVPLVDLTPTDPKNFTAYEKVPVDTYPLPSVLQQPFGKGQGIVSGYIYPNESVAVISIPSFSVDFAQDASTSFGKAISDTLYQAQKTGVRKIVVDVSGNGGGVAFQAYDSFKRIFPDLYPYQLVRAQATDALKAIGSSYDAVIANERNIVSKEVQSSAGNEAAGGQALTSTKKLAAGLTSSVKFANFSSWFGPLTTSNSGKYTKSARFDFSDLELATGMGLKDFVFGFGNSTVPKDYPRYSPSDVVLLTDGFCGSTCAVFAELMVSSADVTVVSVGGVPTYGPMQYAGGSRGGNVYPWAVFDETSEKLRAAAIADPVLAKTVGLDDNALKALPPKLSDMKYADESRNRVNVLDQVRADDSSNTPLSFIYEPADCRLFHTRDMILDHR